MTEVDECRHVLEVQQRSERSDNNVRKWKEAFVRIFLVQVSDRYSYSYFI